MLKSAVVGEPPRGLTMMNRDGHFFLFTALNQQVDAHAEASRCYAGPDKWALMCVCWYSIRGRDARQRCSPYGGES